MAYVKIAKMNSEVAWPIVARAEELKKLDGRAAESVIKLYFKLKGYNSDRYGNYFPGPGKSERYHFKKRNVQRQRKSAGAWYNRWSVSFIDYAEAIVLAAGQDAGQEERVEHIRKKAKARVEAKETATVRRKQQQLIDQSSAVASERVYHKYWDLAYPVLILGKNHELTKKFNDVALDEIKVEQDKVIEEIEAGKGAIGPAYTTDKPPLLIFKKREGQWQWKEKVDGKVYTVAIANRGRRGSGAAVHIGKSGGFGLQIDPYSMSIVPSFMGLKAEGDAYLAGVIEPSKEEGPRAIMTAIAAPNKAAGMRVLTIWCDLMLGYGVQWWLADSVLSDEAEMLDELIDQGKAVAIARRGHRWQLECLGKSKQGSTDTDIVRHFHGAQVVTTDDAQRLAIDIRKYAKVHGRQMNLGEAMLLVDRITGR